MNTAAVMYIMIFLTVLVAAVVTLVLFLLLRRVRKEKSFVGFTPIPKAEKYAGYALLAFGAIIIAISIVEMLSLLTNRGATAIPFNLSDISISLFGLQITVLPGRVLGAILGIAAWLLILMFGGRKIATLGLDMLKGRKVILKSAYRKTKLEIK